MEERAILCLISYGVPSKGQHSNLLILLIDLNEMLDIKETS
jgi:hypothetical protein